MMMLRRVVRSQVRLIHHTSCTAKEFENAPDNAPSLDENQAWLNTLGSLGSDERFTFKNLETYTVEEGLDELNVPKGSDFATIGTPSQSFPFFKIAFPFSNFRTYSSIWSNMTYKNRPKVDSNQSFADIRCIKLRSGAGGNGSVSFLREANRSRGPPDGGDGGDGGDIYVEAVEGIHSLHRLKVKYVAGDGGNGQKNQLDGKTGDHVVISVPVGTVIKWCPDPLEIKSAMAAHSDTKAVVAHAIGDHSGDVKARYLQFMRKGYGAGKGWLFKADKDESYHLEKGYFTKLANTIKPYDVRLAQEELETDIFPLEGIDFSEPTTTPLLVLKGGKGGMGNMHFLTSDIRNPRFAKQGRDPLEQYFIFELKLLADLGLVGLPNSGKSTLLRAISRARPKIGHWAFTTLQPTIGTIPYKIDKPPFTVADIPGIIEGAKDNKGLGLNFLRHIERSGGLVFVVSLDSASPVNDLELLMHELGDDRLANKKVLIVATKADTANSKEHYQLLKEYVLRKDWKIVPCCAMKHENIQKVIELMAETAGKN